MATRSLILLVIWIAFLADLMVGAGLLLSQSESLRRTGVTMVLGAAVVMVGLTLAYYVQQRRKAGA